MLTTLEHEALSVLLAAHDGVKTLGKHQIEEAWLTVRQSLLTFSTARASAQRLAQAKRAENPSGNTGRPPSQWFTVAMGSLWERRVLGAKAALQIVAETLTEYAGNGEPPTIGSVQVQLSKRGHWHRHMYTDNGEHGLTVAKCKGPVPD